jgi:hypothetical protein
MYGGISTNGPWVTDPPDPVGDLAFAEQAVTYLRGRGLDDQSVVEWLRDEFAIDQTTAERIAHPPV